MFSFASRNDSKQYHSTQVLTDGCDQIQHISLFIAPCMSLLGRVAYCSDFHVAGRATIVFLLL